MAEVTRRRVTYTQLEHLWKVLNKNKNIATGYNKTAQAREFSKRMWEGIAQNLNSHGDGAVKDWKGWCKYWNDYKSKIKKSAAAARASHQLTGGGPSSVKPMTDIEIKFLQILGDDFGSGLLGVRVEPFPLEHVVKQEAREEVYIRTPTLEVDEGGSESILAAGQALQYNIGTLPNPEPGPSSRITPPSRPSTPPTAARATAVDPIRLTPRRLPRRRRQARRDPPMMQDAARRKLVQLSERRLAIEERNSEAFICIATTIQEIKEILQHSSILPPRAGE